MSQHALELFYLVVFLVALLLRLLEEWLGP
jgi:hypothetical protein